MSSASFSHRSEAQRTEAYASPPHSLSPSLGYGASQRPESVLANSGRVGEVPAGAGKVRSSTFLNILHGILLFQTGRSVT